MILVHVQQASILIGERGTVTLQAQQEVGRLTGRGGRGEEQRVERRMVEQGMEWEE